MGNRPTVLTYLLIAGYPHGAADPEWAGG